MFAAPEFSLHVKRWRLLAVGGVSCRGYYDRRDGRFPQACGLGMQRLSAVTALRSQR
ncbi:MAG: hypothetical protein V5B40_02440 [Candidatus Accumulibacter meliphilus]|uniref:hypothetical protein n=1 Tax=Candidatus Accumulibacter meliphilus TaxID=2211374 RepID=UPI002FC39091